MAGDAAAERLESVMLNDLISRASMSSAYGLLLNEARGVRDDLIATNLGGGRFKLALKARNKHEDLGYLRLSLSDLTFELHAGRALLALSGQESRAVMTYLGNAASGLGFMTATQDKIGGVDVWVSCLGYTGEDGLEISVFVSEAARVAQFLLAEPEGEALGSGDFDRAMRDWKSSGRLSWRSNH